jgi:hypothetical protein
METGTKIRFIPDDDLNLWIAEQITTVLRDFGQKADAAEVVYLSGRMKDEIKKHRDWHLGEVAAAFDSGVRGNFGPGSRVTVALLYKWIRAQNEIREKRIMRQSSEQMRDAQNVKVMPGNTPFAQMFTKMRVLKEQMAGIPSKCFPSLKEAIEIEAKHGTAGLIEVIKNNAKKIES